MPSPHTLKAAARHKSALRRRIAGRREECVASATRVLRPLGQLDAALALWRRVAPYARLAALPLGWLLFRRRPALSALLGAAWHWLKPAG